MVGIQMADQKAEGEEREVEADRKDMDAGD